MTRFRHAAEHITSLAHPKRPAAQALLAQPLDWDFTTMEKQSAVGQSKKRERAESAPSEPVSVAQEELVGSAQVELPAHLRSAQGPTSFKYSFDLHPGALPEASVRAVSGESGEK